MKKDIYLSIKIKRPIIMGRIIITLDMRTSLKPELLSLVNLVSIKVSNPIKNAKANTKLIRLIFPKKFNKILLCKITNYKKHNKQNNCSNDKKFSFPF